MLLSINVTPLVCYSAPNGFNNHAQRCRLCAITDNSVFAAGRLPLNRVPLCGTR